MSDDPFATVYPPFKWANIDGRGFQAYCPIDESLIKMHVVTEIALSLSFSTRGNTLGLDSIDYCVASSDELRDDNPNFRCPNCGNIYSLPPNIKNFDWH